MSPLGQIVREQRRPTKAELFAELGLSPPARNAKSVFGSSLFDIQSSPEVASRPTRLALVDAGKCHLYRFAPDGSKEIAVMKAGEQGFLQGWFGLEGPFPSEIPNIMLQLPALPIIMKRPAAAPKRKPQQQEEPEEQEEIAETEIDEDEEEEGDEEEGEEEQEEEEEEEEQEDEEGMEEEDLENDDLVSDAKRPAPLDVSIFFGDEIAITKSEKSAQSYITGAVVKGAPRSKYKLVVAVSRVMAQNHGKEHMVVADKIFEILEKKTSFSKAQAIKIRDQALKA